MVHTFSKLLISEWLYRMQWNGCSVVKHDVELQQYYFQWNNFLMESIPVEFVCLLTYAFKFCGMCCSGGGFWVVIPCIKWRQLSYIKPYGLLTLVTWLQLLCRQTNTGSSITLIAEKRCLLPHDFKHSPGLWLQHNITGVWSLIPLLGVKIIHLVCRTDLFKISNLVYGGR
jgi:hypothetical protein